MTRQEWVRVSHTPSGTTVTTTIVEGTRVVRWTEPAFRTTIRETRRVSKAEAERAMAELVAAEREEQVA